MLEFLPIHQSFRTLKTALSLGENISFMKEPEFCLRNYLEIKCLWKNGQKTPLVSDTSQTYTRLLSKGDPTNDHPRVEKKHIPLRLVSLGRQEAKFTDKRLMKQRNLCKLCMKHFA